MKRPDWAARMHEVIDAHKGQPFVWGERDCCLFGARVHDAIYGTEIEAEVRAEYSDEASAIRYIAKHGGLCEAVSHHLGPPSNARAVRGDLVLFEGGEGDAVGVCIGSKVVAMGPNGLRYVHREAANIKAVWQCRR